VILSRAGVTQGRVLRDADALAADGLIDPAARDAIAAAKVWGQENPFDPNPPPTKGEMTWTFSGFRPKDFETTERNPITHWVGS
jgi:hypothetical protein